MIVMSNSSLVSYTRISPNRNSPRNHKIDTITIHCVVGQCSVERLGEIFASSKRQASANYGIGPDGRIGMYVEEKDRSWCSSSSSNDNRAITIEVASDTTHPYKVTDAAYKALIDLLVDICKRNNIESLKWEGLKALVGQVDRQNMTVHRWFANKSCPGDYLYNRHGQIANEVNKRLKTSGNAVSIEPTTKSVDVIAQEVIAGKWGSGTDRKKRLTNAGYDYGVVQKRVNEILTQPAKKSIDTIAREVIQGKWGVGTDRKKRLTNAGYNYNEVQKRVNELL
jgi:hypothetical protein